MPGVHADHQVGGFGLTTGKPMKSAAPRDVPTGSSIVAVEGPGPLVVLTYDDGPQPGGTDAVLEALAERGATATFFVLLSRVRAHRSLLDDVLAAGHEIALHGPDHRRITGFDPETARARTAAAKDELEDAAGREVRWFRPPYGGQSPTSWQAVRDAGLEPVLWSADCRDWLDATDDERLAQVRGMHGPGSVVLAHDGFAEPLDGVDDGPPPRLDRGRLTRMVLETVTAMGIRCCSVDHALTTGEPVRRVWLDGSSPSSTT